MAFTASIRADIDNFERNIEKAMGDINRLEREVNDRTVKIGRQFEDFGKKATILSVGIVAGATGAIKAAVDFESAFAGVRKTVDASESEFAALSEGIRQMALEIPSSAAEIASIAEAAGQLGIENKNILSFTRTMIDLGQATNLSAEQAATQLARLTNIMQTSQEDFDRLGSTIVALGNNLATTEAEISDMALRLAGAGKQVGLTEAQVLALSAALSSVGIDAEAGGSAFSRVLVNMQLAVETGGEALQNFASVAGMTAEQFAKAFRDDASNALISFITGLQNTEQSGVSAIKVLDDMGITEIRMRDALLRAAGAGDLMRQSVELGTQAWQENNALTEEAARRYETTASQLNILKNNVVDLGIQFGEILLPTLNNVVDILKDMVGRLRELSPEMQKTIIIVSGLTAALGPLLIALGKVLQYLPAIKASFAALNPAIAAVGIGIVHTATNFDKSVEIIKSDWEYLVNYFEISSAAVTDLMELNFRGFWDNIKELFSTGIDYLKNRIDQLKWYFLGIEKDINPEQAALDAALAANEMTGIAGANETISKTSEDARRSTDALMNSFADNQVQIYESEIEQLTEALKNLTTEQNNASKVPIVDISPVEVGLVPAAENKYTITPEIDTSKIDTGMAEVGSKIEGSIIDMSGMVSGLITDFASSIGEAFGSGNFDNLGAEIINAMGKFAQQFGAMLIAAGTAALGLQVMLTQPWVAIAAGAALVALGAAASAAAQSMVNNVTSGGYSSAPSMNNTGPTYGPSDYRGPYRDDFTVTFVQRGSDLVGVLDTAEQRRNRI